MKIIEFFLPFLNGFVCIKSAVSVLTVSLKISFGIVIVPQLYFIQVFNINFKTESRVIVYAKPEFSK